MGSVIRVLTLNLWGRQGDWEARREILVDGVADLDPDIITFQESIVLASYDQLEDVLPATYTFHHQLGRSPDGTGNSIASRLRLGEVRERFLQVSPRMDPAHRWIGSMAAADVQGVDPATHLLLVHLKPSWQPEYEYERQLQALETARFIEDVAAQRDVPVVLAGDFDASPSSPSIRFWKGHESIDGMRVRYLDAWDLIHPNEPGETFPSPQGLASGAPARDVRRRIDYVMVRQGSSLQVVDCFLVFDQPVGGAWGSDHFGVVVDLALQ